MKFKREVRVERAFFYEDGETTTVEDDIKSLKAAVHKKILIGDDRKGKLTHRGNSFGSGYLANIAIEIPTEVTGGSKRIENKFVAALDSFPMLKPGSLRIIEISQDVIPVVEEEEVIEEVEVEGVPSEV